MNFLSSGAPPVSTLPIMSSSAYDVIFVGAGHNALVSAVYLLKAGRSVCLLEGAPSAGGWVRSEELTRPGFVHDTFSAVHPILVYGPVFAEIGQELADQGLRYVQSEIACGASLPDGRAAVISTDATALAAELDRLGESTAWARFMADIGPHLELLFPLLGLDLTSAEAAPLLARLQTEGAGTALPFQQLLTGTGYDLICDRFSTEEMRSVLLPWLLHIGIGPHDAGGALWCAVVAATIFAGNPQPVGGSGRLADALIGLVTKLGGEIRTGTTVDAVLVEQGRAAGVRTAAGETLSAGRAVVAGTSPGALYGHLLRDVASVPAGVRAQAQGYRYRRGCFQINLALSQRPSFADPRFDQGGGFNLGRGVEELVRSVRQADDGYLPAHPSISWHEPTALDPDRAPDGGGVVRIQVLDTPLAPIGDAAGQIETDGTWSTSVAEQYADRIVAEAALHVENLPDLILARHLTSPADLAAGNPNAGPGDHASGHNALAQGFTQRPIAAHGGGYATAVPGLYLIGAASWPGPGVSGTSGRAVAQRLIAEA